MASEHKYGPGNSPPNVGQGQAPTYGHLQSNPGGVDIYRLEQMEKKAGEVQTQLITQAQGQVSPVMSFIDGLGIYLVVVIVVLFATFFGAIIFSGGSIKSGFESVCRIGKFAFQTIFGIGKWVVNNVMAAIMLGVALVFGWIVLAWFGVV